jgi:two-component system, cell cycle sensor histidine kinase and response regulator CckA
MEEEAIASLLDALPAAVWAARADTLELVSVNQSLERLLKYPRMHLLSEKKFWLSRIHPDDRQAVINSLKNATQRQSDTRFSCRLISGEEEEIRVESVVRFMRNRYGGQLIGVMIESIQSQVTEDNESHRKLESQLRQAQKMEAIGQLAGSVSHDFNNALMAIHGFCEILLMKLRDDDPGRREVVAIQKATEQATGIARQLLAFGRKHPHNPRVIRLNDLLKNLEPMIQRLLNEQIELRLRLDLELGQVNADPGQMEQVILNLTINARDAMSGGGKFTIETFNADLDDEYAINHLNVVPGPYVVLALSDTGIGMDDYTRSRIFEPFFTTKSSGTGLGLSTCFGIVKQSGGEIWVYSEPGKGSTFRIYLPRVKGDSGVEAIMIEKRAVGGNETILIVDDTEPVRNSTARILALAGYQVLQASSGREALALLEHYEGHLHLLISDIVMPGMGGRELAQKIRERRPGTKILFMSGYTMEAAIDEEISEGARFLAKPATLQVLLSKIREILD